MPASILSEEVLPQWDDFNETRDLSSLNPPAADFSFIFIDITNFSKDGRKNPTSPKTWKRVIRKAGGTPESFLKENICTKRPLSSCDSQPEGPNKKILASSNEIISSEISAEVVLQLRQRQ